MSEETITAPQPEPNRRDLRKRASATRRMTVAALLTLAISSIYIASSAGHANAATTTQPALSCPRETFNWYLQNASKDYSVMVDNSNDTYVGVHQLQRFDNVVWNFCPAGKNANGDLLLKIVDEGSYGVVGDCAADTGPTLESGSVAYFKFASCSADGTSFIERVLPGGNGFRLESNFQLNQTGRAEYITVRAPQNNDRLFLAEGGTDWQAWNGSPCDSSDSC